MASHFPGAQVPMLTGMVYDVLLKKHASDGRLVACASPLQRSERGAFAVPNVTGIGGARMLSRGTRLVHHVQPACVRRAIRTHRSL